MIKKYWPIVMLVFALLAGQVENAFAQVTTQGGGTGTTSPSGILNGVTGNLHLQTLKIGSGLTFDGTTLTATAASGSAYPFPLTGNATSTLTQFNGGASTTQLSAYSAYFGATATSSFDTTGRLTLGGDANIGTHTIYGNSFGSGDSLTMNGASGYTLLNGNNGWGINLQADYTELIAGGAGDVELKFSTDNGLSRLGAGVLALGNGTYQDTSGGLILGSSTLSTLNVQTIATTTKLAITGITGSTQCLHVNTLGQVSGTVSDCGTGTVTGVTATYPILSTGGTAPVISTAFGTTTNNGMPAGFLYSGSGGIWQTAASSSLFGYTPLNPTRNINTTAPLGGGGALTSDLTLTCTSCSTFSYPFTPSTFGVNVSATSTPILDYPGFIAATSTTGVITASSSIIDQPLATPAGTFVAADPTGKLIATTSPSGSNSAFSPSANYATAGALPSNTYLAGVITAVANGALSVDGANPSVGQRVLVKNESTAANNGLYDVTAAGSAIAAFVLTRDAQYNSSSNIIPGIITYVISGATNDDDFWAMVSAAPITVGTTALNYTEVSGGGAAVTSVSNSDSTLTISPTAGNVVASLNLGHANTWSVLQTFGNATSSLFSTTYGSTTLGFIGTLTLSTTTAGCLNTSAAGVVYAATCSGGSSFAYPFNFGTTFATGTAATSTSIWLQGGSIFSSSTVASQIPYASTTVITAGTNATNRVSIGVDSSGFGSVRTLGSALDLATDGSHTININSANTGNAQLNTNLMTTDRQFNFPDTAGTFCLTVTCDTFAWPFTPSTFGINVSATTTPILDYAGIVAATSTFGTIVASSSITNQSVKSALVVNTAGGLETAYTGGTTCTNQFYNSVNAIGNFNCASLTLAGFPSIGANTVIGNLTGSSGTPTAFATSSLFTIGTGLTQTANTLGLTVPVIVSSGGTNATSFSANNLVYANSAGTALVNLGSATTTTSVANDILSLNAVGNAAFTYASSTQLTSGGSSLGAPTFYINSLGNVTAKDVATTYSGLLSPVQHLTMNWATTTTWTATTSGAYAAVDSVAAPFSGTVKDIVCMASSTKSFLGIEPFINGATPTPSYFVASSTIGTTTLTAGNTFIRGQLIAMFVGTTTTDANAIAGECTFDVVQTI